MVEETELLAVLLDEMGKFGLVVGLVVGLTVELVVEVLLLFA